MYVVMRYRSRVRLVLEMAGIELGGSGVLSQRCVQVLCLPHRSVVVCLVLIPPLSRELVLSPCVCSSVLRRILMWV